MAENNKNERIRGGRNLIILGLGAIAITFITTALSLYIYRVTGDVYFDCTRPGFVCKSDTKEDEEKEKSEKFPQEGGITLSDVDRYIRLYEESASYIYDSNNMFSPEVLSDDTLGITDDTDTQSDPVEEPIE